MNLNGYGCAFFPRSFARGWVAAQSSVVLMSITIEALLKCLKKGKVDSGKMQKRFNAFPAS